MRIIDEETIIIPNRRSEIDKVPKVYEKIDDGLYKLKLHATFYIVRTWQGLGDNIYQLPFVRQLKNRFGENLVLKTPWPELFEGIKVTRPLDKLQAQSENVQKNVKSYLELQNRVNLKLGYITEDLKKMSIISGIEKNTFQLEAFNMSLLIKEEWKEEAEKLNLPDNTILLYPPTIRSDWYCPERNPDPIYFQKIIDAFPEFYYVSLGYIRSNLEKYEKELTGIHRYLDKGELHYTTIFALLNRFPAVLRPSFMLPASISVGGRSLCLYGGHFSPEILTDPRMDLKRHWYVAPEPFTNWYITDINKKLEIDVVLNSFRSMVYGP